MSRLLVPIKLASFLAAMTYFFVACSFVRLLPIKPLRARRWTHKIMEISGKWVLRSLKVELSVHGSLENFRDGIADGALVVGNHLSYLDVPVLSSIAPLSYITSVEVKDTPVLGPICEVTGCIFVERRSRSHIEAEILEITQQLSSHGKVVLFAEGTSSNGFQVLPFKKSLFDAAIAASKPVVPILILYPEINGIRFDRTLTEKVAYFGDHHFLWHLLDLMKLRQIKARVEILNPIPIPEGADRRWISDMTYNAIQQAHRRVFEKT